MAPPNMLGKISSQHFFTPLTIETYLKTPPIFLRRDQICWIPYRSLLTPHTMWKKSLRADKQPDSKLKHTTLWLKYGKADKSAHHNFEA